MPLIPLFFHPVYICIFEYLTLNRQVGQIEKAFLHFQISMQDRKLQNNCYSVSGSYLPLFIRKKYKISDGLVKIDSYKEKITLPVIKLVV